MSRRSRRRRPEGRTVSRERPREAERRQSRTGKKESVRHYSPLGREMLRLFIMVVAVAVILTCAILFFKVTEIQVAGSQLYTDDQVIGAAGIANGDNLMTIERTAAAARIKVMLPYIENVKISRYLPGTVVIEVTESGAAFSVEAGDGTSWLINASGKVLEEAGVGVADYPKLVGVIADDPEAGEQMETGQQENLEVAQQLLRLLEGTDLVPQITEVNVERAYDAVIWYGHQYEVHLGSSDRMEYKLRYLLSILDQLDSARGGVIDLTLEEKDVAIFREFEDSAGGVNAGTPEPEQE